jgi:hypothetical protein
MLNTNKTKIAVTTSTRKYNDQARSFLMPRQKRYLIQKEWRFLCLKIEILKTVNKYQWLTQKIFKGKWRNTYSFSNNAPHIYKARSQATLKGSSSTESRRLNSFVMVNVVRIMVRSSYEAYDYQQSSIDTRSSGA